MKQLLYLSLLFLPGLLFGQYTQEQLDKMLKKQSDEQLLLTTSQMLTDGYLVDAEVLIDHLLAKNPENANYNYRKGVIVGDARSDFSGAIPYLEKATSKVSRNYDLFSGKESSASPEVFYYLGKAYHRTNQLDKAQENYQKFLTQTKGSSEYQTYAKLGLTQIENAHRYQDNPKKNCYVINIGPVVNSVNPDYSPMVSLDGSALYYTSRRHWDEGQSEEFRDPRYGWYPEDIYVVYRDFDDAWVEPQRLPFCTPDQNEASVSVSSDERRVYIYQDLEGNGDLYYSDFSMNRFSDIHHIDNKDINTEGWDTHIVVTPDGRTAYFCSEREGGYGGRDIYRIVKLPNGSWSKPINLGPMINTEFDEDAPFMASDNKTLYFASNGPKSMGGFDILVSVVDRDNNWSESINLGVPVNSTSDDIYYTETIDGRRGYITSIRPDSKGEKDIYEVRNDYLNPARGAILKGKILTLNGEPLPEDLTIAVVCTDCNPDESRTVYPRQRDGLFMMNLSPCHTYDIVYQYQDGKVEIARDTLTTDCKKQYEEFYREVVIDPKTMTIVKPKKDTTPVVVAPVHEPLAYKHMFGYNKNVVEKTETSIVDFLRSMDSELEAGRGFMIDINSSASFVPTQEFSSNQELARTRADKMLKLIKAYYSKSKYAEKLDIRVVNVTVSGPEYANDRNDYQKYFPYQYVEVIAK